MMYPSLFLVSLFSLPFLTPAQQNSDLEALIAFRSSVHDPLRILSGWSGSTPSAPCDWRGVACYDGRVSELTLPRCHLGGRLTYRLVDLTRLRKLNLRSNNFTGTIPPLSNLTLLRVLFFQDNSFSGTLNLPNITNLQAVDISRNLLSGSISWNLPPKLLHFDISYNTFSGQILPNIATAGQIQVLDLSHNHFSGQIPASLGQLQRLRYLSLDSNNLIGPLPSALGNCSSLVMLTMEKNSLTGTLPGTIGALPGILQISLSHNNLSGSVPSSFLCNVRRVELGFNNFLRIRQPEGCRSVLQELDLQWNYINSEFPPWFTSFSWLRTLDFSGNLLHGKIPNQIGNMSSLEELRLADNLLIGVVPSEISKCNLLRVLDLQDNGFEGEISSLLSMRNLTDIVLARNLFSGSMLGFSNTTALESLILRENNLTGKIPVDMMYLRNLTVMDIAGNKFSGKIPVEIGNLSGLVELNMSGNFLSGSIPASLGTLYKLRILDLSRQNLSGDLPFELTGLPNIEIIALQQNMLFGSIPDGFGSLTSLRYLNLSSNEFYGRIPPAFGYLHELNVLSVSHNRISGKIPGEISKLSHLQTLDLSSNNFTGKIPVSIASISTLRRFNVTQNDLEGEIPAAVGFRFNDPSEFAMNKNLCGKPLSRRCDVWSKEDNKRKIVLYALAASGACLMALCCCFYIFSFWKWRRSLREGPIGEKKRSPSRGSSGTSTGRGSIDNGGSRLVIFRNKITLADTVEATKQFDEENVLNRSRYGLLFKASYPDGTMLSIHRLPRGSIGESNFRREAEFLGRLKHKNLTVLRGYFSGSPDMKLLVYDYMPNGNLAKLLQEASQQEGNVLNWPMRHLIALGVSRGLAFLHAANMIHGDVKPQNVLFDADFEPHLTDFGLDRFVPPLMTEASSSGSSGYVAPEVAVKGDVRKESDIYSFGVVLLELLTGRRPVMFTQDDDIVKWVKGQLQNGHVAELLEPGLLDLDPDSSEWEEFLLGLKVGLLCTGRNPTDRPTMPDVVAMLEGCRSGAEAPSSAVPTGPHSPA